MERGSSPPPIKKSSWKDSILNQIELRNKKELHVFQDLIVSHNRLFENFNTLKHENLQLSIQNEKLRSEGGGGGAGNSALESKLLAQQEELTELHRKRGEHAQLLIDLNKTLQEKEKEISTLQESLSEQLSVNESLSKEIARYKVCKTELENLNQVIRDEHQALQLAFTHLEEKLRKEQDVNNKLFEQLMKYKKEDAERLNSENENFLRKRAALLQRELEEAAKDMRGINLDAIPLDDGPGQRKSQVPTRAAIIYDAHDGEVSAVQWGPVDRTLATGGADRKVKLWDVSKGSSESRGSLGASNAGVMSVHFDTTGGHILAASNDYAARVWTVADQRLRHTLTGHSGKVLAAKFLGDPNKVATGSHDRTLKIWDLRSKACTETKFAGSCCNDLVVSESAGSAILSGHWDKKIRCWDVRMDLTVREILLQAKVTSLDMGRDGNTLLACVRDESLKLIDLRVNQVIQTYSAEGFKVGCDWARAVFSAEGNFVLCGSSDGNIYVWNTASTQLHTVLKYHTCPVTAVSWHPHTSLIASVDRSKKCIIWADH